MVKVKMLLLAGNPVSQDGSSEDRPRGGGGILSSRISESRGAHVQQNTTERYHTLSP